MCAFLRLQQHTLDTQSKQSAGEANLWLTYIIFFFFFFFF